MFVACFLGHAPSSVYIARRYNVTRSIHERYHTQSRGSCQEEIKVCHLKLKSGRFAIESWTRFQLKTGLL